MARLSYSINLNCLNREEFDYIMNLVVVKQFPVVPANLLAEELYFELTKYMEKNNVEMIYFVVGIANKLHLNVGQTIIWLN